MGSPALKFVQKFVRSTWGHQIVKGFQICIEEIQTFESIFLFNFKNLWYKIHCA